MSVEHKPKFSKNARVRLRSSINPAVYGEFGAVGNEGWIRDYREDPLFGFPEPWIEWDKTHWTYNGARDGWTFEDHFELVEENMAKKKKNSNVDKELLEALKGLLGDNDPNDDTKSIQSSSLNERLQSALEALQENEDDEDVSDAQYDQEVAATTDRLREAEGFIVVGMELRSHPQSTEPVLTPFMMGKSKSPETELLIASNMAHIASVAHRELALEKVIRVNTGNA